MKRRTKLIIWLTLTIAILAVLANFFINKKGDKIDVTTDKAAMRSITETVTASGQIYPENEVKISPDISGEVVELNVEEGDPVVKGQILARVYADMYALQRDEAAARVSQSQASVANSEASLLALKSTLDQAQQLFDRNKKLFEDKVISESEYENYKAQLASAKANYNAGVQNINSLKAGVKGTRSSLISANKNLARATIVAPMSGIVSSLLIKKGERVVGTAQMAGTEMMKVADMNILELRVNVGENDIVKVNIGDPAEITVDAYSSRKFKGFVTKIASSVKTLNNAASTNDVTNYEVRIRLEKQSYSDLIDPALPNKLAFRPGMNASAEIKTKQKDNILSVPIASVTARAINTENKLEKKSDANNDAALLIDDEREEVVFVLTKEGKVQKRVVKSGIQDVNYIEILSGLKKGDEVVTAPYNAISQTLKDGDKVKVVTKEELQKKQIGSNSIGK
ncbi:MAG: efflux RND transporter periplasmic adaptor subunit [Chitinophagaceae bacterium]|nr:MAG: efflux RND transporter periplasmic adaptor subunit [Chitinophagaceae bacterium]